MLIAKSQRVIAHHGDILFWLSCQFCCQRSCTSHLLSHSVRLLLVILLPRTAYPSISCLIPLLGTSVASHGLRPWHLSTMHDAGVDESNLPLTDLAKTEAFVDEPLIGNQLRDFGLVRESQNRTGLMLLVLLFLSLSKRSNLLVATSGCTSTFLSRRAKNSSIFLTYFRSSFTDLSLSTWACECSCVYSSSFFQTEDLVSDSVVLHLSSRSCPQARRLESV